MAVEGDPAGAADLSANAQAFQDSLRAIQAPVESFLRHPDFERPEVVVLDPPRAGVAREALAGLIAWGPPRIVYVSCDPPTLARDAAQLAASGYRLTSIDAFDLFPNTPHVEAVAVFGNGRHLTT
jgi:tRNA/tmRNA/rRNA uracil-C5-methylase (TrmA/RlmC/RlmD family)